jgi:hypothetical protein
MHVTTPLPPSAPLGGGARAIQTRAPGVAQPAVSSRRQHSTNNLKRLIDALAPCPAPHLLDVGRLCDQNINWLIQHRCKVTVDDQITTLPPPPAPPKAVPAHFRDSLSVREEKPAPVVIEPHHPGGSFDAILCWDLLDYLDPAGAHQSLQRLAGLLKPKGYLLAFFNCERVAARPATRYRIIDAERLEYEPLPDAHPPGRAYENREIQELFAGFELVNSCYLTNQMREILVQKKPVRGRQS